MTKNIYEALRNTCIGFICIIIYCIISMIIEFSYLDLCYMFVVIGFFVDYLIEVNKLYKIIP